MKVTVEKITNKNLADRACSFTAGSEITVKDMSKLYRSEHSPIRTQWFWIEMYNIPAFVSTHLVRHKIGVEHFVKSLRDDNNGKGDDVETRNSPVNHAMMINAQALVNMARKRLCFKAHEKTFKVMKAIHAELHSVDVHLSLWLKPECEYRKMCPEFKPCGYWERKNAKTS